MRFSSAGSADEDHVASRVEEGTGSEFANQTLIDRRVREDELANILKDREPGAAHSIADRTCLPMGLFRADQAGEKGKDFLHPAHTLCGDLVDTGAECVKAHVRP